MDKTFLNRITSLAIIVFSTLSSYGQTSLSGKVTDSHGNETIPFATIALYQTGILITGTDTDFDGNYIFSDIDPGTYDVEANFLGYTTSRISGLIVEEHKQNKLDFILLEAGEVKGEVHISCVKMPLLNIDKTSKGGLLTAEDIKSLPTKKISAMAATVEGLSSSLDSNISMRSGRNSTVYFLDGKEINMDTPQRSIKTKLHQN